VKAKPHVAAVDAGDARDRKAEHIRLALESRMQLDSNHFESWTLEHRALPEIDFADIDTSVEFLGKHLRAPLLISCMTGGTEEATRINRNLAAAAEEMGIAVGVGSQRKAFERPETADSFRIRAQAPTVPVLANLGAVQLNYGFGVDECRQAVDMIGADALVFHLNALQEAIQPEGQRNFAGLADKMGAVAKALDVPVIVKEIGSGISATVARELVARGLRIVDTAGVGGTSWARIEGQRADDLELGERFADWGIPTPDAIRQLRSIPGLTIIGSGGVRNGIDAAKAVALGANVVGMAYPFLKAATESSAAVADKVRRTLAEMKICMFCVGARSMRELQEAGIHRR
jgi:isopentenyl-diphosphate delta-isomerase